MVRNRIMPIGKPNTYPKNPETNVIKIVSNRLFKSNEIVVSSSISFYGVLNVIVIKVLNGLSIFV